VCSQSFVPRSRYQTESDGQGGVRMYCSLTCRAGAAAPGVCSVCSTTFAVTYAYQARRQPDGSVVQFCSEACAGQRLSSAAATAVPAPARPPAPPTIRPYRLAVLNQKGGTGKTTTSVSVAAGLALKPGNRVLLVDCDPQGNVAHSLGAKANRTLYHVLVDQASAAEAVVEARDNLGLLLGDDTLAAAEIQMAQHPARGSVLSKRLLPVETSRQLTHVLVDCGPSLSLINQNALCYVDEVLVPVACDYLSLVGVKQVLKTVKNIQMHLGHDVRVGGVVPTFYDGRAKICRDALLALQDHFGPLCLEPVRNNTKLKEAPSVRKTIFEHDPNSTGAADYRRVVDHVDARSVAFRSGAGAVQS
jgi:chromosome partitioning protein